MKAPRFPRRRGRTVRQALALGFGQFRHKVRVASPAPLDPKDPAHAEILNFGVAQERHRAVGKEACLKCHGALEVPLPDCCPHCGEDTCPF